MIQVRDVLQVKFGKIDQAVDLFTGSARPALAGMSPEHHFSVLTDVSGPMYTLVNEYTVPSLSVYEAQRDQSFAHPDFDRWFKQFQLFVEGGQREFYHVEGPYASWQRPGCVVVREAYRTYKWQIRTAVSLLQRYGALLADRGVGHRPRILTDASGPMFKAVIEIETDSVSNWETQRRTLYRDPEFQVWFVQLTGSVEAGSHEFFRVEYTLG